jgi:molybdenum cofactor cytidylyltransferase
MAPIIAQRSRRTPVGRSLAILVLAAGGSRRLGRCKQLVASGGEALVQRVTRLAAGLRPAWLGVVVGARAGRVGAALAGRPLQLVHARRWRLGMAASLAAGIRAVPRDLRHVAILTSDQWQLDTADLARLVRARGRVPAAAAYEGTCGIPAVFPSTWRRRLLALRGDRGARALLVGAIVRVPMPTAAADLDTPFDLTRLRSTRSRGRCR